MQIDEVERRRLEQLKKDETDRFNQDLKLKLEEIYRRRSSAKRIHEQKSNRSSEGSRQSMKMRK